jgi:hypothetical protein
MVSKEPTANLPAVNHDQADRDRVAAHDGRLAIGPATGLLFGLMAAALSWLFLSAVYPVFVIPDELAGLPPTAPVEQLKKAMVAQQEANARNDVSFLGAYGVLLGALLAIGEGLARRSLGRTLVAGAACVSAGAVFGSLAGGLGHYLSDYCEPLQQLSPLAKTIIVQGAMLATVGCGLGLALGVLTARARTAITCLIGGILAGALAGMLYPMLTAILLPGALTEILVPIQTGPQTLWLGLASGLMGLTIPAVARERKGRTRPSSKQEPRPT